MSKEHSNSEPKHAYSANAQNKINYKKRSGDIKKAIKKIKKQNKQNRT